MWSKKVVLLTMLMVCFAFVSGMVVDRFINAGYDTYDVYDVYETYDIYDTYFRQATKNTPLSDQNELRTIYSDLINKSDRELQELKGLPDLCLAKDIINCQSQKSDRVRNVLDAAIEYKRSAHGAATAQSSLEVANRSASLAFGSVMVAIFSFIVGFGGLVVSVMNYKSQRVEARRNASSVQDGPVQTIVSAVPTNPDRNLVSSSSEPSLKGD